MDDHASSLIVGLKSSYLNKLCNFFFLAFAVQIIKMKNDEQNKSLFCLSVNHSVFCYADSPFATALVLSTCSDVCLGDFPVIWSCYRFWQKSPHSD